MPIACYWPLRRRCAIFPVINKYPKYPLGRALRHRVMASECVSNIVDSGKVSPPARSALGSSLDHFMCSLVDRDQDTVYALQQHVRNFINSIGRQLLLRRVQRLWQTPAPHLFIAAEGHLNGGIKRRGLAGAWWPQHATFNIKSTPLTQERTV